MRFFYKVADRFFSPLGLLSLILQKSDDVWIFGEYSGFTYSDNPKALYEFVNQKHPEIKAVWLTRKCNIVKRLKKKGFLAFHVYSPMGLYYAMRAKVAICCVDIACDFIGGLISSETLYVNLWHGSPLKKIGNDIDRGCVAKNDKIEKFKKILCLLGLRKVHPINFFISASDDVSKTITSAFSLDPMHIKICGYPRNDQLLIREDVKDKLSYNKIIYMPTFRGGIGDNIDFFDKFGFDFSKMERFLAKNNAQLWIRLHRYNQPQKELLNRIENSRLIHIHKNEDIYEDLNSFDVLITDFSSIYFDYLLLDRPIIFSAFDVDGYLKNDRALYYNYSEVTPGPKCVNWNDIIIELELILNGSDNYYEQRSLISEKFNKYKDVNSSKRVFEMIYKAINSL